MGLDLTNQPEQILTALVAGLTLLLAASVWLNVAQAQCIKRLKAEQHDFCARLTALRRSS